MGEVYEEFVRELTVYRERYASAPAEETTQLWLMALEREQIVAVGYRDDLIRRRLDQTRLPEPVRALMRQALLWAWKDEEMHAIYIRGALLRGGGLFRRVLTFAQQWAGAVGGWVSSVRQNVRWREAPLSRALATVIAILGLASGKVSRAVRKQLRFHPFREFCEFNVDAERTAALAWARLAEIAEADPRLGEEARAYRRMEADERRHARIFESFARALTPDDGLAPGHTAASLAAEIGEIGEVFLPRALRRALTADNPLGAGGLVVVRGGEASPDRGTDEGAGAASAKRAVFRRALEDGGLRAVVEQRAAALGKEVSAITVAVKTSFMFGYNKRDPSPVIDPELLAELGRWLGEIGVRDVAVVEAPNLYDRFYGRRSVSEVARYLGIEEGPFRLVDVSDEQEPHSFVRGMAQHTISRTWQDADVRVSFGKMRSHPVEMAYLSVANVESLGGRCDEYLFSDRQAHRDAALMTVLNEFPPHFALLDAYALVPDGLMGTMGCPRPRHPRRVYAGVDALSVDITAARHMGVADPTRFPLLRAACHWFGDPSERIRVDGDDTPIPGWRGPYATEISTMLSFLASPVYVLGSGRGALFVSEIDEEAFPPLEREGFLLHAGRVAIRMLLGLRLPR